MLIVSQNCDLSGTTYHRDSKPVPLDLAPQVEESSEHEWYYIRSGLTFGQPLGQVTLTLGEPLGQADLSSDIPLKRAW